MSQVDIYADDFGTGPGLEVSMRWVDGEKVMVTVKLDGQVFESYAPRDVDTALAAVGYLMRGRRVPRAVFRSSSTPPRTQHTDS